MAGSYGWLVDGGRCDTYFGDGRLCSLGWSFGANDRSATMIEVSADEVAEDCRGGGPAFPSHRSRAGGPALPIRPCSPRLSPLAKTHRAELVLMHVVDGAGGQWYGPQTGDAESRQDEIYLQALAQRLRQDLAGQGVPGVQAVLGYGKSATRNRQPHAAKWNRPGGPRWPRSHTDPRFAPRRDDIERPTRREHPGAGRALAAGAFDVGTIEATTGAPRACGGRRIPNTALACLGE